MWFLPFLLSFVVMLASPALKAAPRAAVSTIGTSDLIGFKKYPVSVQKLITSALNLTRRNLTYTFGSADPRRGGMDCSGAIYYLLQSHGCSDAPRQSDEMAAWISEKALLRRTESARSLEDPIFKALQPGDLIFWSGTYVAKTRKLPVTHVMLYLGRLAKNGKPVVFGSSDGRRYEGQKRTGVSVFDLVLPKPGSTSKLYGFGRIPGVNR